MVNESSCQILLSSISLSPNLIEMGESTTATIKVADINGNPVSGVTVQLYSNGESLGSEFSGLANGLGECSFSVSFSDEGVYSMYCVVEADAPYGASTSNTVLLFCKNKNNLLHPNAWSGTDYSKNMAHINVVGMTANPSTEWSSNGKSSIKMSKLLNAQYHYIDSSYEGQLEKGELIKGKCTIYNPQDNLDLYIIEQVLSPFSQKQTMVAVPASEEPQEIIIEHIIQQEGVGAIKLRLIKNVEFIMPIYVDDLYLGRSDNLLEENLTGGGVNNTGITGYSSALSVLPSLVIDELEGDYIEFSPDEPWSWCESRINQITIQGEKYTGSIMIKNPQTPLRVCIWEYSAAGTECSSYVNVGRSVEWQTIQVSHIIQSSDANRISLRVAVLNSGTIYFKQMRLTSSS